MEPKDNKYELELAIDATSKSKAVAKLLRIFGDEAASGINRNNISKHGDLFFIQCYLTDEQLSDENYKKLKKNNKITVLSDSLAIKRAQKLLKYCLPVEVQLKKLLTYVYPNILEVFDGKTDKKSRIQLCKQINAWYLRELLDCLEFDIFSKRREELFIKDGYLLTTILETSTSFSDFKNTILPQIRPTTVWDQVCVVLKKPVDYINIKDKLQELRKLRNKAAHPNIILNSDITIAKKYSEEVMDHIQNVKNDYGKELSKSIKTLEDLATQYYSTLNNLLKPSSNLSDMKKYIENANLTSSIPAAQNIDWLAIDSKIRQSDQANISKNTLQQLLADLNEKYRG